MPKINDRDVKIAELKSHIEKLKERCYLLEGIGKDGETSLKERIANQAETINYYQKHEKVTSE